MVCVCTYVCVCMCVLPHSPLPAAAVNIECACSLFVSLPYNAYNNHNRSIWRIYIHVRQTCNTSEELNLRTYSIGPCSFFSHPLSFKNLRQFSPENLHTRRNTTVSTTVPILTRPGMDHSSSSLLNGVNYMLKTTINFDL